ncbi:hypothetical protein [Pontibacter pamirensis]|uniref:hypothetical protein n=1 Tax=Pontibacter pamirensis TaxID=2562824 RepID=UPI001389C1EA|nr:hypothetical protein [Pontibacter pamirensis]
MSELTEFSDRLRDCDLIVLTSFCKDHTYCRFFLNGIYKDSMHLSNPVILGRLQQLSGAGDEITAGGVAKLIKIFVGV